MSLERIRLATQIRRTHIVRQHLNSNFKRLLEIDNSVDFSLLEKVLEVVEKVVSNFACLKHGPTTIGIAQSTLATIFHEECLCLAPVVGTIANIARDLCFQIKLECEPLLSKDSVIVPKILDAQIEQIGKPIEGIVIRLVIDYIVVDSTFEIDLETGYCFDKIMGKTMMQTLFNLDTSLSCLPENKPEIIMVEPNFTSMKYDDDTLVSHMQTLANEIPAMIKS